MTGHTLQDWYHQLVNKVCLSLCKKSGHSNLLSWDITKILQTFYFGYLRHTWLPKPKKTKSPCWKLCCLFTYKILTWFVASFLRYCTLKNSSIWLANRICHLSLTWERDLCQVRGLHWNINDNMMVHFRLFSEKN